MFFKVIGLGVVFCLIAGCNAILDPPKQSMLDKNWGRSFEAAKYNQILNPKAPENLDPVAGLDGEAAKRNMDKYHESFETPPPEPSYNIDFGDFGTGNR